MTRHPLPPRPRLWVRAALAAMGAAAAAGVVYLLATTAPTPDSYYPKCTLHQLTGLHCPGCGTGRAAHAALNGRVAQALAFNPLTVVLLPLIAGRALVRLGRWVRGRPTGNDLWVDARLIWVFAVLLIAFGVLRNVPVYPLTLLAPHEL